MYRRFIKAQIETTAPLKIGSGASLVTDSDVLLDSSGKPFIPGTALAGVLRHYLAENGKGDMACDWFGYIVEKEDEGATSGVITYDIVQSLDSGTATLSIRDGVALDEYKTAKGMAKYDYQVVDSGQKFTVRIEIDEADIIVPKGSKVVSRKTTAEDLEETLIEALRSGDLAFGCKTTRGFGAYEVKSIERLSLDLSTPEGIQSLINFDWTDNASWEKEKKEGAIEGSSKLYPLKNSRTVDFDVSAFLMIRDYATQALANPGEKLVVKDSDGNPVETDSKLVDAEMLKDSNGKPIIPGTSWSGLFRHHMYRVLRRTGETEDDANAFIDSVFGTVKESDNIKTKSNIVFMESTVTGNPLQLNRTRNAVDRFTGGAGDKKLFTTQASYGGQVSLTVKWREGIKGVNAELLKSLIDVTIQDLKEGFAAIGGLTAIGGGILKPATKGGQNG
jgi:CRISPR/Cas system CSM-associated protein Csm3 (group 7 of RAMP superfamily)